MCVHYANKQLLFLIRDIFINRLIAKTINVDTHTRLIDFVKSIANHCKAAKFNEIA